MMNRERIIAFFALVMGLMMTLPLTVSMAQDATPTPIPAQGEEDTSDSAAPAANIEVTVAPTAIGNTETETDTDAAAPESTAVPEATDTVSEPVDTLANAAPVCPIGVQDAFTATEILCSDLASGEACIGNGTVAAVFGNAADNTGFAQSNDRATLDTINQLSLTSTDAWTVMRAQIRLATSDGGDIATGTMFAYGNVTLEDTGRVAATGAAEGTVIAARGMNVRRTPGNDGVVVWQLGAGENITVTGITADDQWIRIVIPNEFAGTGWVYAPYMQVENGADSLPVVTVNSPVPDLTPPEFAPGQSYRLTTGTVPEGCEGDRSVSGILFQSPSGTPDDMRLEINGVALAINGTVFIQAQAGETLRVSVLEGQTTATALDESATASSNDALVVALTDDLAPNGTPNTESVDVADLGIVPTRLLPRQIAFDAGATEDIADVAAATPVPSGFGTPAATAIPASCTLTAPDVRNVRSGPSTAFEIVQVLEEGDSVEAVGQAQGELNLTWFQTAGGGWIRVDTVETSGGCGALPVVDAPELPEATAIPDEDDEETDTTEDTATGEPSLSSSTLAPLACDGSAITGSTTSDGTEVYVAIGGTWTANAGTTATYTTQGGLFRPELGDYIQLVTDDGTVLASSGEGRSLTITFDTDVLYEARFSAANGDTVLIAASCN